MVDVETRRMELVPTLRTLDVESVRMGHVEAHCTRWSARRLSRPRRRRKTLPKRSCPGGSASPPASQTRRARRPSQRAEVSKRQGSGSSNKPANGGIPLHLDRQPRRRACLCRAVLDSLPIGAWSNSVRNNAERSFLLHHLMVGRSKPSGNLRPAYYGTQLTTQASGSLGVSQSKLGPAPRRPPGQAPREPEVVELAANAVLDKGIRRQRYRPPLPKSRCLRWAP